MMVRLPKFPIRTPRLSLRPLVAADAEALYAMDSDPRVHTFLGDTPVKTMDQIHAVIAMIQAQYAANGIGRWAVVLRQTGQCIGWAGLKFVTEPMLGHGQYYDLGYRLHHAHWGRGYATEAASAVLHCGFEQMQLPLVLAQVDARNAASLSVLNKLGFVEAGWADEEGVRQAWLQLDAPRWRALEAD